MPSAFGDERDRCAGGPLNLDCEVSEELLMRVRVVTVFWMSSSVVGSTMAAGICRSMSVHRFEYSVKSALALLVRILLPKLNMLLSSSIFVATAIDDSELAQLELHE